MSKIPPRVPSLRVLDDRDSDENEEDEIKPIKKQAPAPGVGEKPKTGLLAFLPPPKSSAASNPFLKNASKAPEPTASSSSLIPRQIEQSSNNENSSKPTSFLVPHVLTKKPPPPSQKANPPPPPPQVQNKLPMLVGYGSESDEEEEEEEKEEEGTNDTVTSTLTSKQQHQSNDTVAKTSQPLTNPFEANPDDLDDEEEYEGEEYAEVEEEPSHKRFKANEPAAFASRSVNFNSTAAASSNEEYTQQEYDVDDDPEPQFEEDTSNQQQRKQQQQQPFDEEALKRFMGKRSGNMSDIQFTDVSVNEIVGDNKAELMKQITSEYRPPSNKEYFTSSSRKSHQITYLAKVAKERDVELRNMWVCSSFIHSKISVAYHKNIL
jgi:hypothetical protein